MTQLPNAGARRDFVLRLSNIISRLDAGMVVARRLVCASRFGVTGTLALNLSRLRPGKPDGE